MKRIFDVLLFTFAVFFSVVIITVSSWQAAAQEAALADSFIFPVKATDVESILDNTTDPASDNGIHGWKINTNIGKYYNNRPKDVESCPNGGPDAYPKTHICGYCLIGFHDADDWNRVDGNDKNEPVYAVANGMVVNSQHIDGAGWGIVIEHVLPQAEDQTAWMLSNATANNPSSVEWLDNKVYSVYLHLNTGDPYKDIGIPQYAPLVQQGDIVQKGQLLGYIDDFGGYHLHFSMKWKYPHSYSCYGWGNNNDDLTNNKGVIDSRRYIADHVGNRPYTFNTAHPDSLYACTDRVAGGQETGYIYSCQQRTSVYLPHENVNMVMRIEHIRTNISFRIEAWREGSLSYDWSWTDPFIQVTPYVWEHAYFLPRFDDVYFGNGRWEMKIFVDSGAGHQYLTSYHFQVVPQLSGSLYQLTGLGFHCSGGVSGGESTNWTYTCNSPQSVYTEGQHVSILTRIDDVSVSHRFRARIYKDGQLWRTDGGNWWNTVPSGHTWDHAYYWTTVSNIPAGNYEVHVDLDTPDLDPFEKPDISVIRFTVYAGPLYSYNGNVVTCAYDITGGEFTNWVYTCPSATSTFTVGDDVRVLVYIQNVRRSHRWRTRFYKDGVLVPEKTVTTDETQVPDGQTWATAYTWPSLWNAAVGDWRVVVDVNTGSGWEEINSNIQFRVINTQTGSYAYTPNSFDVCRGNYLSERNATTGVPACSTRINATANLSPSGTYYWRLRFTGLTTIHRFRLEAYYGGDLDWSYDFGPYTPQASGEGWFFPEFVRPRSGAWELLFYIDVGDGFELVDTHSFFVF